MKFPDQYRAKHPLGFAQAEGDPFGFFMIPSPVKKGDWIAVMATEAMAGTVGYAWDHVSASLRNRCPTWEEMCFLKDLFWDPEDTVIQFHPPRSEYVNRAQFCLHLWRYRPGPFEADLPRPPRILV